MSTVKCNLTTRCNNMMTLPSIRDALKDRRLQVVADATGIHYNTLKNIRDNPKANPTWEVLRSVSDYLDGGQDNQ